MRKMYLMAILGSNEQKQQKIKHTQYTKGTQLANR